MTQGDGDAGGPKARWVATQRAVTTCHYAAVRNHKISKQVVWSVHGRPVRRWAAGRLCRRAFVQAAAHLRDAQDGVVRLAGEYASDRIAVTKVGHARLATCATPLSLKLVDGHTLDEATGRLAA
jgi:hypothetical protein